MEIRRSYDRLISTMGFLILVRRHLYIESGPWYLWSCSCPPAITYLEFLTQRVDQVVVREMIPGELYLNEVCLGYVGNPGLDNQLWKMKTRGVISLLSIDIFRPEQNGWYFADNSLKFIFLKKNNNNKAPMDQCRFRLLPSAIRWQAISQTNVLWLHMASLGLN